MESNLSVRKDVHVHSTQCLVHIAHVVDGDARLLQLPPEGTGYQLAGNSKGPASCDAAVNLDVGQNSPRFGVPNASL